MFWSVFRNWQHFHREFDLCQTTKTGGFYLQSRAGSQLCELITLLIFPVVVFFPPSCLVNGCGLSIHDAISLYSLISSACSAHLAVKHAEVVPLRGPSGKRSWRRRLHVIVAKRMFQPVSTLCCYRRRPTTHWWPQVFTLLSWCSFELTKPSPTLNTKRSRSHLRVNQSTDYGAGVIGSMGGATLWR